MRCSKCGTESTGVKKFCAECGSPLASRCPKCGADNKPTSKFCEECGAALVVSAASASMAPSQAASAASNIRVTPEQPAGELVEGERKTVTALFADIKGSTELMEDLDPEAARAIIDPALSLMIEAVQRFDGYVVNRPATASLRCLAHRWPTRTIRSGRCMRLFACRKRCGATRRSCARAATSPSRCEWE
jgi:hypothetical protein